VGRAQSRGNFRVINDRRIRSLHSSTHNLRLFSHRHLRQAYCTLCSAHYSTLYSAHTQRSSWVRDTATYITTGAASLAFSFEVPDGTWTLYVFGACPRSTAGRTHLPNVLPLLLPNVLLPPFPNPRPHNHDSVVKHPSCRGVPLSFHHRNRKSRVSVGSM